ncbi:hypothetical protein C8J56DRAFT_892841 [Mycena floridula]|nr:hypothetical protein C8J56DRAFT_892841 [Mycena floridula]
MESLEGFGSIESIVRKLGSRRLESFSESKPCMLYCILPCGDRHCAKQAGTDAMNICLNLEAGTLNLYIQTGGLSAGYFSSSFQADKSNFKGSQQLGLVLPKIIRFMATCGSPGVIAVYNDNRNADRANRRPNRFDLIRSGNAPFMLVFTVERQRFDWSQIEANEPANLEFSLALTGVFLPQSYFLAILLNVNKPEATRKARSRLQPETRGKELNHDRMASGNEVYPNAQQISRPTWNLGRREDMSLIFAVKGLGGPPPPALRRVPVMTDAHPSWDDPRISVAEPRDFTSLSTLYEQFHDIYLNLKGTVKCDMPRVMILSYVLLHVGRVLDEKRSVWSIHVSNSSDSFVLPAMIQLRGLRPWEHKHLLMAEAITTETGDSGETGKSGTYFLPSLLSPAQQIR